MKTPHVKSIGRSPLRLGFLLILLALTSVIPFALAQRNSKVSEQSAAAAIMPSRAGADSILEHFQPQATQPAPHVIPMRPSGGIDCDNQPGITIHDDGGLENGYSGAPGTTTEVRFADKFTPSSYPASYTSVCLDFVIVQGGPPTYPIDVVVFDDDGAGGSPGTLLGELNGQTATTHLFSGGGQSPIWNSYDISSLGLNITSGSVYIGARWVPPANNIYLSADESGPVGFAHGYWWNDFDGVWSQTQNAFGLYTSMFIRAVGSAGAEITLSATKRKVGGINTVRLTWRGATSTYIDVYRDGMPITRTQNRGSYDVSTGDTGRARYTYRVCEFGTSTCSNDAIATFAH